MLLVLLCDALHKPKCIFTNLTITIAWKSAPLHVIIYTVSLKRETFVLCFWTPTHMHTVFMNQIKSNQIFCWNMMSHKVHQIRKN